MNKIIGNTTATPNPRPDWDQNDSTKADYIKNKPSIECGEGEGSIQQNYYSDNTKNPKATGLGAIALGGFRGDKSDESPSDEDTTSTAEGIQSFVVGAGNHAYGNWSVVMGKDSRAYQRASVALGAGCIAGNPDDPTSSSYGYALAQGTSSGAFGWASAAFNNSYVDVVASYSFAANNGTVKAPRAVAFGSSTVSGEYSFAAGQSTTVSAPHSGVVGYNNSIATDGVGSFIAGRSNYITYRDSMVLGNWNQANGERNFILGDDNIADHAAVQLVGNNLRTEADNQTLVGKYNKYDTGDPGVFVVGCGDSSARKNAFTIWESGNAELNGTLYTQRISVSGDTIITGNLSVDGTITLDSISNNLNAEFFNSIY